MSTKVKIEVECANCGITFLKNKSEVTRRTASGVHYCSLKCCGHANHQHLLNRDSAYDITQHSGNRRDQYSGLRTFLTRGKAHGHEVSVTLPQLKEQWERQQGRCAYTNIELNLPIPKVANNHIYTASLDRINSSMGYIEGNIQFVSIAINHMKGAMSHEQTVELIGLIKGKYPSG